MLHPSLPEHFILHFHLNRVAVQEIDQDGAIGGGRVDPLHLVAKNVMHWRPSLLVAEGNAGGFNSSIGLLRRSPCLYPVGSPLQVKQDTITKRARERSPRHRNLVVARAKPTLPFM